MKKRKIKELVKFFGIFYEQHKVLPPGYTTLLCEVSRHPCDVMVFLESLECDFPEALEELKRLQATDTGECEDSGSSDHPGRHKHQRPEPHLAGSETKPEYHYQRFYA